MKSSIASGAVMCALVAAVSSCASASSPGAASPASHGAGLAGRNFYATYDNGRKFLLEFTPDGKKQRYTGVVGKSNNETVDVETRIIAPDIYMVSWIEPDGFSVTRVDDLANMTIQAYWSWDDHGKRVGQMHTGKLEATEMTRERLFREQPSLATNPPEPPR